MGFLWEVTAATAALAVMVMHWAHRGVEVAVHRERQDKVEEAMDKIEVPAAPMEVQAEAEREAILEQAQIPILIAEHLPVILPRLPLQKQEQVQAEQEEAVDTILVEAQ